MESLELLLQALDAAAANYEFPGWECGQQNAVIATMRASGFAAASGVALVFEQFEHSIKEGVIQPTAFCFATVPTRRWISPGDGVSLFVGLDRDGRSPLVFGDLRVASHGQTFVVPCSKRDLVTAGLIADEGAAPSACAVLLRICEVLPREALFSPPDHLQRVFGLPDDAALLFALDAWRHPSFDELYDEPPLRPSACADLVAMAEALCRRESRVQLRDRPNTTWREQCGASPTASAKPV